MTYLIIKLKIGDYTQHLQLVEISKKINLKKTYLFNFVITEIVYNFVH